MNLQLSLIGSGRPGSHVFGAEGGAFGRSQKCDWVLPDEERILSSVHGRLVFSNGQFMLVDESTNGIFVNGLPEPLGRGNSIVLTNGTRFSAGRYTIEAKLVAAERPQVPKRQNAGYGPASGAAGGFQHYAAPSASKAENALHDRSELGQLWAQNSQDPMSYLDGPVDAGLVRSFDPAAARDPYGHGAGSPNGFAPAPPFQGEGDQAYGSSSPDPLANLDGNALGRGPGANDPLQSLDSGLLQQVPDSPNSAIVARVPQPQAPLSLQAERYFPQAGGFPQAAQPSAGGTIIPEDFLAGFGKPKRNQDTAFLQPAAQPQAVPMPLSQRPMNAALPPAPPSPQGMARIPDNFDPLSVLSLPGRAKPAPVTAPPAVNVPLPPTAPPATGSLSPLGTQAAVGVQPPLPPVGLPPAAPELKSAIGTTSASPDKPGIERPKPLSPSLMADMVEFGAAKEAPNDGAFEALRARREQRKAAMLKKAQANPPSVVPPMPASQPMPSASPGAAAPAPSVTASAIAPASGNASDSAVVRSFLEGMGFQDSQPLPGDPQRLMNEAGAMVRAMAAGLISLLSARKMLKSEFRMDETQVQPEENNPFKFFKVAELALDELFLTRSGGFQVPAEAARSAFEDLEQHTMLTMSATQRAIKLLFERLSPEALTREAGDEGGLRIRGLGGRKGKMEMLIENHERMSRNIDNVARQIIAEAFAQVQEEQARKHAKDHWGNKQ